MKLAEKKKKKICCFIDTYLFLHFQTFDEIDWKKILQASQVDLVIAPVLSEEDAQLSFDFLCFGFWSGEC